MTAGKVLATGATAFAGGALARRLVSHDAPLNLDRDLADPKASGRVTAADGSGALRQQTERASRTAASDEKLGRCGWLEGLRT
jgi:hypothetical protein